MLRLMRENAGSWIIKILLGIVVLVFVFLGIGPNDNNTGNTAAVVNDKVITMDEYRVAYNNLVAQYRAQFGNNMNDELIKLLGVKSQALENLISRTVMIQEADKLGLKVTDEELYASISKMQYFRKDGAFKPELYKRVITGSGQTPEYFEARIKEDLVVGKLRKFVTDPVVVSDSEISEWYQWKNAQVKIEYAVFAADKINDVTPTDAEITGFYGKNGENYKTQPKIQVNYLQFTPDAFSKGVTVSDADVEAYYAANGERYETPATVEARHILLKVDEGDDEAIVEFARKRAFDIYVKAKSGNDFSALAKEFSEGPSKESGGYLGVFEKERMVKPFADKAFSMEAGEISEPVRTRFGWHVIKVVKVNEASKKTLAEVKPEIIKMITKERAENLAYDAAGEAYDHIIGGDELSSAADAAGLKVLASPFFTRSGEALSLGAASRRPFADAAFGLENMEISDILDFEGAYYIVQVTGKKESEIPALDTIKSTVTADLVQEMKDKKASEASDKELAALKEGKAFTVKVAATDFFKRDETVKDLDRSVVEAAFNLKEVPEVVKGTGKYYVIRLAERKKADPSGLEKEKEEISKTLLNKKTADTFSAWLKQVTSEGEIERVASL